MAKYDIGDRVLVKSPSYGKTPGKIVNTDLDLLGDKLPASASHIWYLVEYVNPLKGLLRNWLLDKDLMLDPVHSGSLMKTLREK